MHFNGEVITLEQFRFGASASARDISNLDTNLVSEDDLTRAQWVEFADQLLLATRPYFTPSHAKAHLPGLTSISGYESDGLEGYARTFLLAGMRLRGANGSDPLGLIPWYRTGLINGTTPTSPDHWPSLENCAQAKVEAASIAIMLDFTRPWIWDTLTPDQQSKVIAWLASAVGDDTYHHNNWRWFRVVVQTFLRSVDGPHDPAEIEDDLREIESFYREDGWYADGNWRSFDHYVGWAMHLYPVLWANMSSAQDFFGDPTIGALRTLGEKDSLNSCTSNRGQRQDLERLERFLDDFLTLVGNQGAPLYIGRSLIYRFATIAPLWAGALAQVSHPQMGQLRRCANLMLSYFIRHGVPNQQGLLDMGWHEEWTPMRQTYSGPASPYWASKGILGVALAPNHPVWTASSTRLPAESVDQLRVIKAPGWIVSTTTDGIVRVTNHGTDRGYPNQLVGDLPEYARWGYSNVTTPLLDESSRRSPLDQAVVLLDDDGMATHRAGFHLTDLGVSDDRVAYAASVAQPHWMASAKAEDFGLPLDQVDSIAGTLHTVSVVRGPWEVRLAHFETNDGHNGKSLKESFPTTLGTAPKSNPPHERNTQMGEGGAELVNLLEDGSVGRSHILAGGAPHVQTTSAAGPLEQAELRCDPARARRLRFGGWALSGDAEINSHVSDPGTSQPSNQGVRDLQVNVSGLTSRLIVLDTPETDNAEPPALLGTNVDIRENASPMGERSHTPTTEFELRAGHWYAVALYLGNAETPATAAPQIQRLQADQQHLIIDIQWADFSSTTPINLNPPAMTQPQKGDAS